MISEELRTSSAHRLLHCSSQSHFMDVLQSKKSSFQCAYLAEYDRYVEQSILYDNNYHMLFCLIEDVTDEANERSKKAKIRQQTTAIADQRSRSRCE